MGRKAKYSQETKIKICEDYLLGRKSAIELSIKYNTHKRTIYRWVYKYQAQGKDAFNPRANNYSYSKAFKQKVVSII